MCDTTTNRRLLAGLWSIVACLVAATSNSAQQATASNDTGVATRPAQRAWVAPPTMEAMFTKEYRDDFAWAAVFRRSPLAPVRADPYRKKRAFAEREEYLAKVDDWLRHHPTPEHLRILAVDGIETFGHPTTRMEWSHLILAWTNANDAALADMPLDGDCVRCPAKLAARVGPIAEEVFNGQATRDELLMAKRRIRNIDYVAALYFNGGGWIPRIYKAPQLVQEDLRELQRNLPHFARLSELLACVVSETDHDEWADGNCPQIKYWGPEKMDTAH
jgi:hypothetical protein